MKILLLFYLFLIFTILLDGYIIFWKYFKESWFFHV